MSKENAAKNEQHAEGSFGSVFAENDGSAAGRADFQTNFGAEGSGMNDIFKGSGAGVDERKRKTIMLAAIGAAVAVCGGAFFLLTSEPAEDEMQTEIAATPAAAPTDVTAPGDDAVAEEETEEEAGTDAATAAAAPAAETPAATLAGSPSQYKYNEKMGGPVVSVKPGATVEVSTREDFGTLYVAGTAKDGKFRIPNPPPGNIFWREQGSQSFHKIVVTPADKLGLSFSAPANMAANEELSWSANGEAAYYRVEFSADPAFENITNVYATAKTSLKVANIGGGKYHLRLAGFNTASGRWEYSRASAVEVK